jgi:hypothetical protein
MPLSAQDKTEILHRLKNAMHTCCPPMVITGNGENGMAIIGNKPVPYGYDKRIIPGMFFASASGRKDMVSFYLFPIYDNVKPFQDLAPIAIKCLKGKTCFNFKKLEQVDEAEIIAMLKLGVQYWHKLGYMQ